MNEIKEWIKAAKNKGYSAEQIAEHLANSGWTSEQIKPYIKKNDFMKAGIILFGISVLIIAAAFKLGYVSI